MTNAPRGYGLVAGGYDVDMALQVLDDAARIPSPGTATRAADLLLDIASWGWWKREEFAGRLTEGQKTTARRIAVSMGVSQPKLAKLFRAAAVETTEK